VKFDTELLHNGNATAQVALALAAIRAGDTLLDFSGVQRCDSAAIALALEALRAARAAGITLRLEALPADMLSLARLYGVEELLRAASGAES
jgi:phospholipid transport system transporter-binding protein